MNRPLVLVYATAMIVGISYGMHNPIVPVFSKEVIGASYFDLGLIGLANFVPYMFIPLIVGLLLDRFNNGLLLSLGITLDAVSIYLLSVSQSVPEVVAFRAMTGVAHSFFWPPCESIISRVVPAESRVKSISKFMGFFVVGLMIGPLSGTFLIEHFDATYRLLFQYATFAIATGIVSSLLLKKYGKTTHKTEFSLISIKQIMKFPTIVTMLIFCSAAFGTFLTIFPAYMSDRSISNSNIELLFFVFGISRLVSLGFSELLAKRTFQSLLAAMLSIAMGMIIVFYSFSFEMFIVAALIMGFGFTVYFPLTFEIIMKKARKEHSGGLIGAYETTFGVGWAAGPLVAGMIANFFGNATPYLVLSGIGIMVAITVGLKRKDLEPAWNPKL
jgi:DHA1 family multidrug resistance protein-like MFS transporter/DHA1 family quinolone resistance protein-like MFS transporter